MVDVVSIGEKISVTSAIYNGFRFISYNDRGRWISNKYLSDKKPAVQSSGGSSSGGGISSASCSKSSSIQSGLVPNAIKVYRALCARYPQISSFGGRRAGDSGFHGTGRALDVMISNSSVGWDIANWTRANASAARGQRGHLLPEDLDGGALVGGLAVDVRPGFGHGQPLRPRARLRILSSRRLTR